jgi:hypothetical protein
MHISTDHRTSKRAQLLVGLVLTVLAAPLTVPPPTHAQTSPVRVRTYELDVHLLQDSAALAGRAEVTFELVEERPEKLVFFLHGELRADSLAVGGQPVSSTSDKQFYYFDYSLVATRVEVDVAGVPFEEGLTIFYSGYMSPSRARTPSDYMRIDADGVLLRSYGYSLWFPIFLGDRETSYRVSFPRVTLRTPADFRAVFVGHRVREYEEGDQRISEWSAEDVDLIDVQCTARRFDVTSRGSYNAYHLRNLASEQAGQRMLGFVEALDTRYRDYYRRDATPAEIHIMEMPRYGNISSDNVVGITSEYWLDYDATFSSRSLLAHELVHPHVMYNLDREDPMWVMAIEGFPKYFYLPVLAELEGEAVYQEHFERVEAAYLRRKETGKDRRGRALPLEKPLLEITADEIGLYKDGFVLGDRSQLFFNYLRARMGPERFFEFTRQLFSQERMNLGVLEDVVLRYLPDARADIRIWLTTSEYPARFRLQALEGPADD